MGKGQSSVELMIILAVSLVVLLAIISYSNESISGINKEKQHNTALDSVNGIVNAANDVFFQGVGARKKVFYEVPSGIDESASGIEDQSVVLNVLESDIYAMAEVQLSGTLPTSQGGHWIWIEAKEGYVSIGTENITADKTSIYVTLEQDSNAQERITITNGGGSTATISIVQTWGHANLTLTLSETDFSLATGNNKVVDLNFSANSSASGNYSGSIKVNASFNGSDENIVVSVNAEVTTLGQSASNLAIFPSSYSATIMAADSDSNSFQTCNLTAGTMTNIEFTRSVGDAGDWVGAIPTISSLAASDCHDTSFTITVPGGTSAGTYNGTITASDGTYYDSISLTVIVTNQSDSFSFSWTPAEFADAGKDLVDWNITNTSGTSAITITRIRVSEWSANDGDGATIDKIRLDNDVLWDTGGGGDGDWINIDDFEIAANTSYSNQNKVEFNHAVDDDGEQFILQFEFSDGSTYTTSKWPLYSGSGDFNFSWATAQFEGSGKDLTDWTIQNTNDTNLLSITRVKVSGWSTNDLDGAQLDRIKLDNTTVWDTGNGNDGDWIDITDFTINMSTSYSTNNKLEFDDDIDDDGEQFTIQFEFSDSSTYTTAIWPITYTVDLWEIAADLPQPLDFSTDINSSANTFSAGTGDDGWDWENGVYDTGSTCVRFNSDPNDDNSTSDSTVGSQNRLRIQIGDYENDCSNDGHGSGAYGVQFEVSSDMYDVIDGGGTATLSFDWWFDDHSLDGGDSGWIKARFGDSSGMNYLGSQDGGSGDDDTPEIIYDENPNDHDGSEEIDVSSYITAAGAYYAEFGGKVSDWENNEWLEAEFDNMNLVIEG